MKGLRTGFILGTFRGFLERSDMLLAFNQLHKNRYWVFSQSVEDANTSLAKQLPIVAVEKALNYLQLSFTTKRFRNLLFSPPEKRGSAGSKQL